MYIYIYISELPPPLLPPRLFKGGVGIKFQLPLPEGAESEKLKKGGGSMVQG